MKRDMDLIRKILLLMEVEPQRKVPGIEGYTSEQIGHHVYLMMQAGLIEGARDHISPRWVQHHYTNSINMARP